MFGPGKYDELCSMVRIQAEARGAIIIVIGGKEGSGMSVQASIDIQLKLPNILRDVAHQIENDFTSYGHSQS